MIKKRLTKAADRSFRLVGAMLMRRAIARLVSIDDTSLSKSGLSRAAVFEFLKTPAGTDPHRFFTRRHAQSSMQQDAAEFDKCQTMTAANETCRTSDSPAMAPSLSPDGARARPRPALGLIRRKVGLRLRVLTAALLVGFGALSACSGAVPERDAITIRREQPASCRLRPDSLPLAPLTTTSRGRAAVSIVAVAYGHRLALLQHARDSPIDHAV